MRIGIGGFQHETNTFAPSRAAWEDFADKGGGWPRLVSGPAMFQAVAGANIPVAGFIEAMGAHTLLPATWAAASPSGPVTRDAYERISALILQGLSAAMPLDGVYLDLHGAMVAEHLTTAKASCCGACVNGSDPTCPSSPAWTCMPT